MQANEGIGMKVFVFASKYHHMEADVTISKHPLHEISPSEHVLIGETEINLSQFGPETVKSKLRAVELLSKEERRRELRKELDELELQQ